MLKENSLSLPRNNSNFSKKKSILKSKFIDSNSVASLEEENETQLLAKFLLSSSFETH